MRYLLDSNTCIDQIRYPDGKVASKFKAHVDSVCVSTITVHELIHGTERAQRRAYQRELVEDLLSKLTVLEFDAWAAEHSGQIHAALAKAGNIIGAYDMLIAGHARSLGLIVVTNNLKEFTRVPGLLCEVWT